MAIGSVWIYNRTHLHATNLPNYVNKFMPQIASGMVAEDGSLVLNGRPFQPIPATMITDYNGVISQDYGF